MWEVHQRSQNKKVKNKNYHYLNSKSKIPKKNKTQNRRKNYKQKDVGHC